jgi:hypothetical protein
MSDPNRPMQILESRSFHAELRRIDTDGGDKAIGRLPHSIDDMNVAETDVADDLRRAVTEFRSTHAR